MKKNHKEESHRSLIRFVADKIGNWHRPSKYIEYIKNNYDVEVSPSSVTKSIGSRCSRLQADERLAVGIATKLLDACYHDSGLASFWLSRASKSKLR
jgi:hypothetical protein